MPIYFNEFDKYPAGWLANLWPEATTDTRSVCDVQPSDVQGYTRVHLFAGIGGWELALRLAGWPEDREVWTGSCPCQPFSQAGQQKAEADSRHLWPEFLRLVAVQRPATIFGEQVASKLGREWLARVRTDLEALGYAVGCADLCAASQGAPHIRQRLYWVADAKRDAGKPGGATDEPGSGNETETAGPYAELGRCGDVGGMDNAEHPRLEGHAGHGDDGDQPGWLHSHTAGSAPTTSHPGWGNTWLPCLDGKERRVEPGTFPLAHGVPGRVGQLRAYGNAVVPQVAASFVKAFLEC